MAVPSRITNSPLQLQAEEINNVCWYPIPAGGRRRCFKVLFIAPSIEEEQAIIAVLPALATLSPGLDLLNGERVYLASWEDELTPSEFKPMRDEFNKVVLRASKAVDPRKVGGFLWWFVAPRSPREQPLVIEMELGEENIVSPAG